MTTFLILFFSVLMLSVAFVWLVTIVAARIGLLPGVASRISYQEVFISTKVFIVENNKLIQSTTAGDRIMIPVVDAYSRYQRMHVVPKISLSSGGNARAYFQQRQQRA